MNADTVQLGVKLVTFVNLRFKLAYTKSNQGLKNVLTEGVSTTEHLQFHSGHRSTRN